MFMNLQNGNILTYEEMIKGDKIMKNITIAEGITATLTNRTYNAMCDYKERFDTLSRWSDSAFEERDWGDYDYYHNELCKLEDEYEWLWDSHSMYDI